jgi:hypothetical protein
MADTGTFRAGLSAGVRVLLWLGLAVAAWLLVVPAASIDGTSCGVPMFTTNEGSATMHLAVDCVGRNQTRISQAVATLVLTGLVLLGAAAAHWWRSPDPARQDPEPGSLGALRRQHEELR